MSRAPARAAYNESVRRLLAIVLVSVTVGLVIPPGIAGRRMEAQLPPCCRANGKHKCALHRALFAERGSGLWIASAGERCPFSSAPTSTRAVNSRILLGGAAPVWAVAAVSCGRVTAQSQNLCQIAATRAHPKRGPPSFLL